MHRNRWVGAAAVVLLACGAGIAARGVRIAQRGMLEEDEVVSYLAATGHQRAYRDLVREGAKPFGIWSPARVWQQRLFAVDRPFCFDRIGYDLATADIHPPLYFWLLHVAVLIGRVTLWTGPALNLGLELLSLWLLICVVHRISKDPWISVMVGALWFVSPVTIAAGSVARQYALLPLTTLLFVTALSRLASVQPMTVRRRDWALLAGSTMLGLLTHYAFILVAIGGFVWLTILWWRQWRPWCRMTVSMAVGGIGFVLLHPRFWRSFLRQRGQRVPPAGWDLGDRAWRSLQALPDFFGGMDLLQGVAVAMLVAAIVIAIVRRDRKHVQAPEWAGLAAARTCLFMLVWTTATVIVPYLLHVTPLHAIGPRYLSHAWPLLAVAIGVLFWPLGRTGRIFLAVMVIMAASWSAYQPTQATTLWRTNDGIVRAIHQADAFVAVDTRSGWLPRVLWLLPPSTSVLITESDQLPGAISSATHSEKMRCILYGDGESSMNPFAPGRAVIRYEGELGHFFLRLPEDLVMDHKYSSQKGIGHQRSICASRSPVAGFVRMRGKNADRPD